MGLVSDLITEVIDSSSDLSQALRKAKLLAYELGSAELQAWADAELNGYKEEDELPDYRVSVGMNLGNFSGPWGSRGTNVPVPLYNLPESIRDSASKLELRIGVAALQEMLRADEDYREQWNANNIAVAQYKIFDDMIMTSAWKPIPKAKIGGVLDTIRNRLLSFLLDLKKQHPKAVNSSTSLHGIPKEDVRVSVINNIYGGNNVFASGETVHQEVQQNVTSGDLESLLAALRQASLPEELVNELSNAVEEDEPVRKGGIGPKVVSWLAKVGEKMTTNTAVALATQAILQYYGIQKP